MIRRRFDVALVRGNGRPRHDLDVKSRVHPKYKTKYHVGNWPDHDCAPMKLGDVTVWRTPAAIAEWETGGVGKRRGQRQYSDVTSETALTLRLLFHQPLLQTDGFCGHSSHWWA